MIRKGLVIVKFLRYGVILCSNLKLMRVNKVLKLRIRFVFKNSIVRFIYIIIFFVFR